MVDFLRSGSGAPVFSHCSRALAAGLLVLAAAAAAPAHAATVAYSAVDLPDTVVGEDLWQYEYTITGAFAAFDTLTLDFAYGLYDQLDLTIPTAVLDAQPPLPGFPGANGLLQFTALASYAALVDSAAVSFVWLGTGTPGAQDYTVADEFGNVYQSGITRLEGAQQPVPEPATLALLLATLLPVALRRPGGRRRTPTPRPS